jgi:hypothetical protein
MVVAGTIPGSRKHSGPTFYLKRKKHNNTSLNTFNYLLTSLFSFYLNLQGFAASRN